MIGLHHHPPSAPRLLEIVAPRTCESPIASTEHFLGTTGLREPFSLEISGSDAGRWFLARAGTPRSFEHLEAHLAATYPQADLRHLDTSAFPSLDPARVGPGEQVSACALTLREPEYLPIRTFEDGWEGRTNQSQSDPILGVLGGLGALPAGWRGLAQLVLHPAPANWCDGYRRLAVEHPLAYERAAAAGDTSLAQVFLLGGAVLLGTVGYQGYQWYEAGDWTNLAQMAAAVIAGGSGLGWFAHRMGRHPMYDIRMVQEKIAHSAYLTQLRLAVFTPSEVPKLEVRSRVEGLAAAYGQYGLSFGNSFVPRWLNVRSDELCQAMLQRRWPTPILNIHELAGLWHLPDGTADASLLERTTARRHLPLPVTVAHGCRIGTSMHQGREVPVSLSDALLHRHLLAVAKTRRGKSTLLLRLAQYLMEARSNVGKRQAIMVVDPHEDLARATLGLVPEGRQADVVYLDVSNQERPFGLNLLDTALFPDRDKTVEDTLAIFEHEFEHFWGPRMEDAFRYALLTLYEANQRMCDENPRGRERQHTILDVAPLCVDSAFRRSVVRSVSDPAVAAWWTGYFDRLDRRLQIEIVNPVQTKVQRFAGSRAARAIVGQPKSTIDPAKWLHSGAIVVVNTAKGVVGDSTAALVGAALLNLMALQVGQQSRLLPKDRGEISILVDEFHSMPGANYESILGELAKYGANLVLATQSLARLDYLDRQQHRELRAAVFANIDGLFAFNTSAEDARYLVRELGEGVDEEDLVSLGEYQCYARIRADDGERLPAFSVRLDPPPENDPDRAADVVVESNRRNTRAWADVEIDLQSALGRIAASHQDDEGGNGVTRGGPTGDGNGPKTGPARNENRNQRNKPPQTAAQEPLPDPQSDAPRLDEARPEESAEELMP